MPSAREEVATLVADIAHLWRLRLDARLRADDRLRPYQLSQAKWRVLLHLYRAPDGLSQRQIAERIGIEGPTVVGLLDRLESAGLLERRACAEDRRRKIVHLLPAGARVAPIIASHAEALRAEVLKGIAPADLKHCRDVLARMQEVFRNGEAGAA